MEAPATTSRLCHRATQIPRADRIILPATTSPVRTPELLTTAATVHLHKAEVPIHVQLEAAQRATVFRHQQRALSLLRLTVAVHRDRRAVVTAPARHARPIRHPVVRAVRQAEVAAAIAATAARHVQARREAVEAAHAVREAAHRAAARRVAAGAAVDREIE